MAGHARFTAVLDACVLFPIATADALVSLAVAGLFSAKWTVAIEDEWLAVAERRHPDLSGRFTTRRDAMRDAVLDWEVKAEGWKALAASLTLPDANDVHVLAAAIAGHADCIVTTNLKDFPASVLEVYGLIALHPDDFIVAQLDLDLYSALGPRSRLCGCVSEIPRTVLRSSRRQWSETAWWPRQSDCGVRWI